MKTSLEVAFLTGGPLHKLATAVDTRAFSHFNFVIVNPAAADSKVEIVMFERHTHFEVPATAFETSGWQVHERKFYSWITVQVNESES